MGFKPSEFAKESNFTMLEIWIYVHRNEARYDFGLEKWLWNFRNPGEDSSLKLLKPELSSKAVWLSLRKPCSWGGFNRLINENQTERRSGRRKSEPVNAITEPDMPRLLAQAEQQCGTQPLSYPIEINFGVI